MFEVRRLGPADTELIPEINRMYGEAFEEVDEYISDPPGKARRRELLGNDNIVLIAAFDAGGVIGALTAYVLPKIEQNRSELFLYDLAVRDTHRRRGVATRLIEEARAIARERDVWMMFIQADVGDEAPIALYRMLSVDEGVSHYFDIEP